MTTKQPEASHRGLWLILVPILCSAVAWAVLFAVIPPKCQEFPLADDWAFGRGAIDFAHYRGIHYLNWASMPLLGQWMWAAPFVWAFGDALFGLRVSTILLSWAGVSAFYDLLEDECRRWPAVRCFIAATLAFHPLFFLLEGTFMTDVPALALALVSLALYRRAFQSGRVLVLGLATTAAVLTVTTRQNTIVVPLVALLMLWRTPELRRSALWLVGVLAPLAIGGATYLWFTGRTDAAPTVPRLAEPWLLLFLPYMMVHLSGLAALPVLALDPRPAAWSRFGWTAAVLVGCAGYWIAVGDQRLPYGGLFPYLDGMVTPYGAYTEFLVPGVRPVLLGPLIRIALTLAGCLGGALLVDRGVHRLRANGAPGPLLIFTALQVPFILIAPTLYDRYFLTLLPGALCLAMPSNSPRRLGWVAGLIILGAMGTVSVCLMHDWLAWNSARWELGRRALARQIPAPAIEGGFEWDGWYTAVPKDKTPTPPRGLAYPPVHPWFPDVTGHYSLSFSIINRSFPEDTEPYQQWLLPRRRTFYLLRYDPRGPAQLLVPPNRR
jgi:hypothetical protein